MSPKVVNPDSPIAIVGAGVFGLSTALHLARRGYSNVTIFDKQPYHESVYSYDRGCDGASSDINKIIRAAYGEQFEYQTLAFEAIEQWNEWNAELQNGTDLPPGLTAGDVLFVNNGNVAMNDEPELLPFEQATKKNMMLAGRGDTQVDLGVAEDVARAKTAGFGYAINPFERNNNYGALDLSAGFVYADKACRFALHKIRRLGVRTVFGSTCGQLSSLLEREGVVEGFRTLDGKDHFATLTIMACGGWTPSLLPELDGVCETTAGSVAMFQVPEGSELWHRLAPDKFPVWTYKMRAGEDGGFYGFPRDESGTVKVGYRGLKYTNPQEQPDGAIRSVPRTRWSENSRTQLPLPAAQRIGRVLRQFIPELVQYHTQTRLCWYTDTFDNHFVIDFVPEKRGLIAATGGSGHGFKFLPILGGFVVDRIEGVSKDVLRLWRWRKKEEGRDAYNRIMEGFESAAALNKQRLTSEDSLSIKPAHL